GGPSGRSFAAIVKGGLTHVSTILVPREAFDAVGEFDEGIWWGDDTDMWVRLAFHFPFRYVPGTVAVFLESKKTFTEAYVTEKTESWVMRRDKCRALVRDAPNAAELTP